MRAQANPAPMPLTAWQKAWLKLGLGFLMPLALLLLLVTGWRGPGRALALSGYRTMRRSAEWRQHLRRVWWRKKVKP